MVYEPQVSSLSMKHEKYDEPYLQLEDPICKPQCQCEKESGKDHNNAEITYEYHQDAKWIADKVKDEDTPSSFQQMLILYGLYQ